MKRRHLTEFLGWLAACIASATVLHVAGVHFDSANPIDVTVWLIVAGVFMLSGTVLMTIPVTVLMAVHEVRIYYRENPDAVPPNKFLVKLGLWGVR